MQAVLAAWALWTSNCVDASLNALQLHAVGPELLDKMVGETERKVRMLFADAEEDFRANGENAQLHVIVLDEMDSVCKTRGSSRDGTGVSDNVVNQFLSKIDGVEALDNVLLIGMTNRKEPLSSYREAKVQGLPAAGLLGPARTC